MEKRVIKNYLYNISYKILIILVPLLTTPYISRVLHATGVGVYSFTYSIAFAFSLFAALGINAYGQREIAYVQDDIYKRSKVFWEIVILRIISTTVVSIVYLIVSLCYQEYRIQLLLQSFLIIAYLFDISWFYQGIENFKVIALRNLTVKIVTIILIFTLVKSENDVNIYIAINSVSVLVSNFLYIISIKKYIKIISFCELNVQKHIKETFEFFVPLIAVEIYSQLDKIMIGVFTEGDIENGYYEQARKITSLIVSVITAINTVLMPRVSNLYINNKINEIKNYYNQSFQIIAMALFPMCIGLFAIADNFTECFFGSGYDKVAVLLKLSSFLIVFMCIGNFVGIQYLSPTGQQNKMTLAYIIAAVINVILNSVLIPKFLSTGAMIASIAAEVVSCFAQLFLLQKSIYKIDILHLIWKYFVSGLLMGLFLWLMQLLSPLSGVLETCLEVMFGAIVYIIGLLVMKEEYVMMVISKLKKNR